MPTQTEIRLARKAENSRSTYIIVDDPEDPTKYWGGAYAQWSKIRAHAKVYTEEVRRRGKLPTGGVWLLVDEEIQAKAEQNLSAPSSELPKAAQVGHACQEARAIERERCARIAETINDSIKHKGLFAKIILNPNTCIIPLNNGTNALNVEHLPDNGNQCVYCGEYLDNSYDASQRLIDELVEALKAVQGVIEDMRSESRLHGHITDASAHYLHHAEPAIRAVIAKAEGK